MSSFVGPARSWILYTFKKKQNGSWATKFMRVPVSAGPAELMTTVNPHRPPACANSPATLCAIAEQSQDLKQLIFTRLDPLNGRGHELTRFDINPGGYHVWALSPDGTRMALFDENVQGPIHIPGSRAAGSSLYGWAPAHDHFVSKLQG